MFRYVSIFKYKFFKKIQLNVNLIFLPVSVADPGIVAKPLSKPLSNCLKKIKRLTIFLFKILVESVDVKYINFEEDIGIDGLRTFKIRLQPSFMLDKYEAFLTKRL